MKVTSGNGNGTSGTSDTEDRAAYDSGCSVTSKNGHSNGKEDGHTTNGSHTNGSGYNGDGHSVNGNGTSVSNGSVYTSGQDTNSLHNGHTNGTNGHTSGTNGTNGSYGNGSNGHSNGQTANGSSNDSVGDDSELSQRYRGTVKWFDLHKGWGWITPKVSTGESSEDIFVHMDGIEAKCDDFEDKPMVGLRNGEEVEYCTAPGKQGKDKAIRVTGPERKNLIGQKDNGDRGEKRCFDDMKMQDLT